MSPNDKPKRLFKVASEFNVSTSSIVGSLSDEGFEVANKPNTKVTPEMYEVLEEVYGTDKANSQQHAKAREEYASRRDQIRASRNESISIEDTLEPLDEDLPLEPEEELPLQPEEDDEPEMIAGLTPVDEDTEEEAAVEEDVA